MCFHFPLLNRLRAARRIGITRKFERCLRALRGCLTCLMSAHFEQHGLVE
jgi:hypothetical protein